MSLVWIYAPAARFAVFLIPSVSTRAPPNGPLPYCKAAVRQAVNLLRYHGDRSGGGLSDCTFRRHGLVDIAVLPGTTQSGCETWRWTKRGRLVSTGPATRCNFDRSSRLSDAGLHLNVSDVRKVSFIVAHYRRALPTIFPTAAAAAAVVHVADRRRHDPTQLSQSSGGDRFLPLHGLPSGLWLVKSKIFRQFLRRFTTSRDLLQHIVII